MGGPSSHVSRVRSEGTHRNTLVTAWKVSVTGIEFINDYWLRENGNNRVNKGKDSIAYPKIKENFGGWGRGPYLGIPQETIDKAPPGTEVPLPWDWEGKDNLHQAACYRRQKPICMKVRLHSSHPAPSSGHSPFKSIRS